MKQFAIHRTSAGIAERMAGKVNNKSLIYQSEGDYTLAFEKRRGKALVPIYPSTIVARKRKDRLNRGERREDNIERSSLHVPRA